MHSNHVRRIGGWFAQILGCFIENTLLAFQNLVGKFAIAIQNFTPPMSMKLCTQ